MTWLLIYLMLGALVAYGNDVMVLKDHTGGFERYNYALRTLLAWPTYILEDLSVWASMNGDDDDAAGAGGEDFGKIGGLDAPDAEEGEIAPGRRFGGPFVWQIRPVPDTMPNRL